MPLVPETDPLLLALKQINPSYTQANAPVVMSAWEEALPYHGLLDADDALKQSIDDHATVFVDRCLEQVPNLNDSWVLLSSGHVYDEGEMICGDCGPQGIYRRAEHPVGKFKWEALCPLCNELMAPKPHAEHDALTTTQPIGLWFIAVETQLIQRLRDHALTILRVFQPYWPITPITADPQAFLVMHLAHRLQGNRPVVIDEDGNQTRCVTWVGDINQAIIRSQHHLTPNHTTLYNIATLSTLPLFSLVTLLQEATQKTDVPFTISQEYPYPSPRHRFADTRQIESQLGYVRAIRSPLGMLDQL